MLALKDHDAFRVLGQAEETFRCFAQDCSLLVLFYNSKGNISYGIGDLDQAIVDHEKAVCFALQNGQLPCASIELNNIAFALAKKGRFKEAENRAL